MGQYGYAEIEVMFKDNAKEEDKLKFMEALNKAEHIDKTNEDDFCFEIHSDRLQNLDYQCDQVCKVASEHECVEEILFAGYTEHDIGASYHHEDGYVPEDK